MKIYISIVVLLLVVTTFTGVMAGDWKITKRELDQKTHEFVTNKKDIEKLRKIKSEKETKDWRGIVLDFDQGTEIIKKEDKEITDYSEYKDTNQSGRIDELLMVDNTLVDVTFCDDKTLKTRQVFIGGVNVIERLANVMSYELNTKDYNGVTFSSRLCKNIKARKHSKNIITVKDIEMFDRYETVLKGQNFFGKTYIIHIGTTAFAIIPENNTIYTHSGFDGSLARVAKFKI